MRQRQKRLGIFWLPSVFSCVRDRKPKESDVVGMRWLLTWKGQDTGNSDGEKTPQS